VKKEGLASNTHTMCAERRLLDEWTTRARRHGVASHATAAWLHRKTGGTVTVVRPRSDGSLGCSVPCVRCREVIVRYRLRVRCITEDGALFEGYLDDIDAPESKLTTGQKRTMKQHRTA